MALSTLTIKILTLLLCLAGFGIGFYAYHVEMSKEHDSTYQALCDIGEHMSCSKVLTSRPFYSTIRVILFKCFWIFRKGMILFGSFPEGMWGRGFGLVELVAGNDSVFNQPNSIYGLAFYAFQVTLTIKPTPTSATVAVASSVLTNLGSVYLASILYFVLHDLCVVCVSIYIVNFSILVCNVLAKRNMSVQQKKRR